MGKPDVGPAYRVRVRVLVTGGAGYIGSHVVRLLHARGDYVHVADDLSSGSRDRVPSGADLTVIDLGSEQAGESLVKIMTKASIEAVIHVAAKKAVAESVARPTWYYRNNVGAMVTLLESMHAAGVTRMVYSSSAAVYGEPASGEARENDPTVPMNPYGETKLVGEWLARDAEAAWDLRQVSLRYFNVAGAGWPDLADPGRANLIPIVVQQVRAGLPVPVFGIDYDTVDGSCVRDYVHVLDLADAHLQALAYLDSANRQLDVFNVGTGVGTSVFEVLATAEAVSGAPVHRSIESRRAGDPARLTAQTRRISEELGWAARFSLDEIVRSAWAAEQ